MALLARLLRRKRVEARTLKTAVRERASVISWPDRFLVHAVSTTTAGIGVAAEPYLVLQRTASNEELGAAIENALSRSKIDVPHPTSWAGIEKPMLKAVGVRSMAQFMRSAKECAVARHDLKFHFSPSRNGGSSGEGRGFSYLPERAFDVPATSSPPEVGAAARIAIERSE
jgi:hypothetical protein